MISLCKGNDLLNEYYNSFSMTLTCAGFTHTLYYILSINFAYKFERITLGRENRSYMRCAKTDDVPCLRFCANIFTSVNTPFVHVCYKRTESYTTAQ